MSTNAFASFLLMYYVVTNTIVVLLTQKGCFSHSKLSTAYRNKHVIFPGIYM